MVRACEGMRLEERFAGELGCLPNPTRQELLVELVVFLDVEVDYSLVPGIDGGHRTERGAAEEGHLDVFRETVVRDEPPPALDTVSGRVPPHGLHDGGHRLFN